MIFETKSIDDVIASTESGEHRLAKALGPVQITMLGIGAIIGAGIFATIGTAAAGDAHRLGAGPALMLSFVISAIVCSFAAFCYAEFASMVPVSGSAYTYAYATLGEVVAWIIGWDLIIEYAVGNVAVAISWANYLKTFLAEGGIHIPDWLSTDFTTAQKIPGLVENAPHLLGLPIVFNLPAIFIVAGITGVLMIGIKESARFNAVMVGIKLLVLGFFVFIGASHAHTTNWTPFMPNGFGGVFSGAAVIFFAFIGFDAVSTVAEEAKNPQRDLPIGIMASLAICTFIYVVVAAVFTAMVPYDQLVKMLSSQQAEPLALAMQHVNIKGVAISIVALGSVIAHTAVLLVFQLGQTRIFYSMARDGLLPPLFNKVHPKFRTPWNSTLLTGLGVGIMSMLSSLEEMVDLTNIGTLFAFILVCIGVIILRVKEPERPRAFRTPGGIVLPVLGIIGCLGLIYYLPPTSWLRFAAWLNLGLIVYVTYGSRHSRLTGRDHARDPKAHDATSSYSGAWLGVSGSLITIIACLADAMHTSIGAEIARPANWWFPQSPWLWVPLLLNVGLLCPVVVVRARRALAVKLPAPKSAQAKRAMLVAVLHFVIVGAYLVAGWTVR